MQRPTVIMAMLVVWWQTTPFTAIFSAECCVKSLTSGPVVNYHWRACLRTGSVDKLWEAFCTGRWPCSPGIRHLQFLTKEVFCVDRQNHSSEGELGATCTNVPLCLCTAAFWPDRVLTCMSNVNLSIMAVVISMPLTRSSSAGTCCRHAAVAYAACNFQCPDADTPQLKEVMQRG